MVFGTLLVLTFVTVGVSYLDLPEFETVIVALIIATTKASLVAMFFMHLKGERPMVTWPLALTAFLFVALLGSLLVSEADHLFGAQIPGFVSQHQQLEIVPMACPVCFGGEDTLMRESLNTGIGVLMGVTAIVLAFFARFVVTLVKRSQLAGRVESITSPNRNDSLIPNR